jgi:hypothetical protein
VHRLRPGSLIWLGSILAGFGLGGYVLAAWPEPTFELIRLPYGESMPKTASVAVERRAPAKSVVTSAAGVVTQPRRQLTADKTQKRRLTGPPPVASRLERDGYRPETAEELGATPLPGMYPDSVDVAVTP